MEITIAALIVFTLIATYILLRRHPEFALLNVVAEEARIYLI